MKANISIKKPFIAILLCFLLLATSFPLVANASNSEKSDDIVILYTNDVHTYIDDTLSYDVLAAIKDDLETKYNYVLLADAGDHIQGTAYGGMDQGKHIIQLMNAADYDVATLGNHEFDYTAKGCLNAIDWADFTYVSCNFYYENDGVRGKNVLDSYALFECGAETIAFIGITTPETFSKSAPSYFQNENGEFLYGITGGNDGSELRQDIQTAIDDAKNAGATKIIALGHLGVDPSSSPWTSEETIAKISGLDAFIDGHSHTIIKGTEIEDKNGNPVLLTQTGEYFNRIGIMMIDSETSVISTDFIEYDEETGMLSSELYDCNTLTSNADVKTIKDAWIKEIDDMLGTKIGSAAVTLDNYDEDGKRLVRNQETNSGDFAADSLYYLFDDMGLDVDVAVVNGGGVRNTAITGDLTYKTCKDIHPFGNVACLQTVSGQQLLDMLEWGARFAGESENGSFLQVSGVTFKINTAIEDTIQANDMDVWLSGPSKYRVIDVKIYNKTTNTWDALDLDETYNVAGQNYILRNPSDGFGMLEGAINVVDYVMEDYMVLANYVKAFEKGVVDAKNSPLLAKYPNLLIDYGRTEGSGRIEIVNDISVLEDDNNINNDNHNTKTDTETSDQNTSVSPQTNDTPIWNLLVVIILCGFIIPFTFYKKRI